MNPATYSPSRTCGLEDAYKRTIEMLPDLAKYKSGIFKIRDFRNEIVHYGGDSCREFEYLDAIVTLACPFLGAFYKEAYSLDFGDFLRASVTREMDVLRRYIAQAKADRSLPRTRLLSPLSCEIYYDRFAPGPPDGLPDDMRHNWHSIGDIIWEERRKRARERWGERLFNDELLIPCRICGQTHIIISFSVPVIEGDRAVVYAEALDCMACGLFIDKSHSILAGLHFGPIELQ